MKTWEELVEMKEQTLKDWFDDGVRCLILRGPGALCAYVGIPKDHPLAGFSYDDIPIECHGGLTYSGEGDGKLRPDGFFWYGWDYAHSGDYCFYYDKPPIAGLRSLVDKKWLVEDVEKDMWSAVYEFKKLIRLAEQIKAR